MCAACTLLTPAEALTPAPRLVWGRELPPPCEAWLEVSTPEDRAVGLRIYVPSD